MTRRVPILLVAGLVGLFFAFVGGMKAFAPIADLARHHAWTVFLPRTAGRLVGWSELASAALLVASPVPALRRPAAAAAVGLIGNQLVAASMHVAHGEADALPQNAALAAALALIAWGLGGQGATGGGRRRRRPPPTDHLVG